MIFELIGCAVVLFGVASLFCSIRAHGEVFRGPHLHARIDELFEPYTGQQLTAEAVASLEADANTLFRDALTGVGLVPNDWHVVVEVDEVLGPVPRLRGPHGELLHPADFEERVRSGRLDLPGG